jgi:hypothetical protein
LSSSPATSTSRYSQTVSTINFCNSFLLSSYTKKVDPFLGVGSLGSF